jgi:serine/threonine-protein kinase RsbW
MNVTEHNVELKVPVDGSYVSVVRLLVSGLGTRLGLPIDELENLKLVAGEAFLTVVEKAEGTPGLVQFKWQQDESRVSIKISDPTGKHKELLPNAANLALLKKLGGEYNTQVVDGTNVLNIDFEIRYQDERPFLFRERPDGRA